MAFVLGTAIPSRASLVVLAPTVSVTPGTSGAFDVLIENTNPVGGASFNVSSDVIQLVLGGGISGLSLTGVTINTVTPYVYVDSGTNHGGGPFSFTTFPNSSGFEASDSEFASPGFRAISPGGVFGLAHVLYSATAGASGSAPLTIGPDTNMSDVTGANIPFTSQNGSISVTASPSTPEPSTFSLMALGAICTILAKNRSARSPQKENRS